MPKMNTKDLALLKAQLIQGASNKSTILSWRHQLATNEWFEVIEDLYRLSPVDSKEDLVVAAIDENCVNLAELKKGC